LETGWARLGVTDRLSQVPGWLSHRLVLVPASSAGVDQVAEGPRWTEFGGRRFPGSDQASYPHGARGRCYPTMCGKPRVVQWSDVGSWMPPGCNGGCGWRTSNPPPFILLFSLYSLQPNYQLHGLRSYRVAPKSDWDGTSTAGSSPAFSPLLGALPQHANSLKASGPCLLASLKRAELALLRMGQGVRQVLVTP
jgi:hypothetical protein